ncbi:MAG: septal ring lytic transglycosylase RlpA family protein [Variovorax sp.]|jgi:rare lipoprotein A|nr:MAG: septal ring lytic transglycosylase RlpA family protein [Variovorax sp.]
MNGEVERGAAGRRIGPAALSVACALAALLLLDGCGATPDPAPVMPVSPTAATPSAPATAPSSGTGLRPLARDISVPSGAPPRSAVTSVNYDLSVSDDDPFAGADDGIPGDKAPGELFQRGGASWYGIQFHQRRTANGERFDMSAFTAAHRTLPFGTAVCVRSLTNGREVLVRVNDRGPFGPGRVIDLSRAAAEAIDMVGLGIKQVAITVIGKESLGMRCGGVPVDRAALTALAAGVGLGGEEASPRAVPSRRATGTRGRR